MILLILFLSALFIALGTGVLAGLSDWRSMTIPNIYSGVIMGAFFAAYALLWMFGRADVFGPLFSHLLSGGIFFVLTVVLFALRSIGAADSKLGTAFAFWVGMQGFAAYLFYTVMAGGVLALAALYMKKNKPFKDPPAGSWPAQVQEGKSKVPYGIAIAFGALVSFVQLGYLGPERLSVYRSSEYQHNRRGR